MWESLDRSGVFWWWWSLTPLVILHLCLEPTWWMLAPLWKVGSVLERRWPCWWGVGCVSKPRKALGCSWELGSQGMQACRSLFLWLTLRACEQNKAKPHSRIKFDFKKMPPALIFQYSLFLEKRYTFILPTLALCLWAQTYIINHLKQLFPWRYPSNFPSRAAVLETSVHLGWRHNCFDKYHIFKIILTDF